MNEYQKLAALCEHVDSNINANNAVRNILELINIRYEAIMTTETKKRFEAKYNELELAWVAKE